MTVDVGSFVLDFSALSYTVELIIAEVLFICFFEKRERFVLRFALSSMACMVCSLALSLLWQSSVLIRFFCLLILIALTFIAMAVCFKGSLSNILRVCTAGVATQHIASRLCGIFDLLGIGALFDIEAFYAVLREVLFYGMVYVACYFLFSRPARETKLRCESDMKLNTLGIVIVFLCVGINRLIEIDGDVSPITQLCVNLYAIVGCVFSLVIQFNLLKWMNGQSELDLMRVLLRDERQQYEQWKSSIDLINIRFHDIKHMLADIRAVTDRKELDSVALDEIENSIKRYEANIKTGNDVLDVLLRNMAEVCRINGIYFSCMTDETSLVGVDGIKLYSLFCNAIDNAISGVKSMRDVNKRVIDLSIKEFGNSVLIRIWNYFEGEIEFSDGLPTSSDEKNGHGFGMKSMKMVVDDIGGSLRAYARGEVFNLDIIIPSQKKQANC